jgi:Subtilase family
MPEPLTRPIQVFLDTQRLIQVSPKGTKGPNKDFFQNDNAGFRAHKARLQGQMLEASSLLAGTGEPAGFMLVQMREEGLGKSYRPLNRLFTPSNRFALVGGSDVGDMYFQVTPRALDRLVGIIEEKAEVVPRLVENKRTGEFEERASAYRSEVGAIDSIRLPNAADRLTFSASEAVGWLDQESVIGGYIVELFRPNRDVTPHAVEMMLERFITRLSSMGGLTASRFASRIAEARAPTLTLSVALRADSQISLDFPAIDYLDEPDELDAAPRRRESFVPDLSIERHQILLDLLSTEPLVRRIELPLRLESMETQASASGSIADIPPPKGSENYPIVGIIDAGVADVASLRPWRAGGAGVVAPADRDEPHGTFIAGLLAGGSALNPSIADRLEPVPCRFFDVDVLPKRGSLARYYQTPEEFFDQLDAQVEAAKRVYGVRIFNMSLGSPGIRQGIGYSSFAAQLDQIAKSRDVIFVVSAGNLRGRNARPEWPDDPDDALEMLATRAIAEERITAPGDHLYGLTIGAINGPGVSGCVPEVPAAYSRRGPGPGGARKPELAHIGGALRRGRVQSGLYSVDPQGKVVDGSGTSFAAPLATASLAAIDHQLEGLAARETLLALAVHKAAKPEVLLAKQLRTIARDFVGFGVPGHAQLCLSDEPHSITLVFSDVLPPKRELAFVFSWPRSLTSPEGRCRGHVEVTLVHTPPVDAAFDAECQRIQLDATLHQLEQKEKDRDIVTEPKPRLKHYDTELSQHLKYTERYLLESGLKWTPIKRYFQHMARGCGTSSEWRLGIRALTRAGASYPLEGVPFALLMTIRDPAGAAPIYDEVRAEVLRRGLRLADITVAQRIRANG